MDMLIYHPQVAYMVLSGMGLELTRIMNGDGRPVRHWKTPYVLRSLEVHADYKTSQSLKNSLACSGVKGPRITFSLIIFFLFSVTEGHLS